MSNRIAVIAGSPSEGSRSAALAGHAAERLAARGIATRTVHVRRLPAEELLQARSGIGTSEALRTIAESAAVVIATPVYKASFSGLLKVFLDLLPIDGLRGKAVLPLATGASPGHMLALDYGLRPVLAALGAYPVLPSVYGLDTQLTNPADGRLVIEPVLELRLLEGVDRLADAVRKPAPIPQHLPEATLT